MYPVQLRALVAGVVLALVAYSLLRVGAGSRVCCALSGAAFSFENDSYFEPGNKPRIGHAILAVDPAALAGAVALASFDERRIVIPRYSEGSRSRTIIRLVETFSTPRFLGSLPLPSE